MAIILRLDIDKPYGRASLPSKILSKVREDYVFPALNAAGYLRDLARFLEWLNEEKIPALSYHRICTTPNARVKHLLHQGGHLFGLHAEDTRTLDTVKGEIEWLKRLNPELPLHSFTKHGSGELKLGRRHYAPYEPDKYREWAKALQLPFLFGNGIAKSPEVFSSKQDFYPDMFWFEPGYQDEKFSSVDAALDAADAGSLVLIVHPENLYAIRKVKDDLTALIKKAKDRRIPFVNSVH